MFLTKPLNIIPFCERQSSQKTTKKLCLLPAVWLNKYFNTIKVKTTEMSQAII